MVARSIGPTPRASTLVASVLNPACTLNREHDAATARTSVGPSPCRPSLTAVAGCRPEAVGGDELYDRPPRRPPSRCGPPRRRRWTSRHGRVPSVLPRRSAGRRPTIVARTVTTRRPSSTRRPTGNRAGIVAPSRRRVRPSPTDAVMLQPGDRKAASAKTSVVSDPVRSELLTRRRPRCLARWLARLHRCLSRSAR